MAMTLVTPPVTSVTSQVTSSVTSRADKYRRHSPGAQLSQSSGAQGQQRAKFKAASLVDMTRMQIRRAYQTDRGARGLGRGRRGTVGAGCTCVRNIPARRIKRSADWVRREEDGLTD